MMSGSVPVLMAAGSSLAETWEKALLLLHSDGCDVRTEYDEEQGGGRPSKDATMTMVVERPASEPMIHRAFPGGLDALEEYRQEVLDGIKDHWVRDPNDPDDQRWEYTYHERIFAYSPQASDGKAIDQIEAAVRKLCDVPFTRRAQAITWMPWCDPDCYDPPCLQSLWFRILEDDDGVWTLNLNVRFRSRDAYDAAFMNCFALISLMERVAAGISDRAGREVRLGRYLDISDSFHIYGRRLDDFERGFLKLVEERSFEERTWTREFAEPFFAEARPVIAAKIREVDERRMKA